MLRIAAAGGARIGHLLLCRVTGLADAELAAALRPAAAGNVITGDPDGYAFRHELIREAVEDDLLADTHGTARPGSLLRNSAVPAPPLRILSAMARSTAAALAGELARSGRQVSGVNGSAGAAHAFAAEWRRRTGVRAQVQMRERLFRLGELTKPSPASGLPTDGE